MRQHFDDGQVDDFLFAWPQLVQFLAVALAIMFALAGWHGAADNDRSVVLPLALAAVDAGDGVSGLGLRIRR